MITNTRARCFFVRKFASTRVYHLSFRMRLFFEDASSPYPSLSPKEWEISEEEIGAVITPYGKPVFMDEDSGIGMESDWVGVLC